MSRRRAASGQDDSLDLLLDTVSNVFGGVMFLTLLAALLILTRGTETVVSPEVEPRPVENRMDARLASAEMRRMAIAIETQQKMLSRLDPSGDVEAKLDRLQSLQETLSAARRQSRRAASAVARRQQELADVRAKQSDLEQQIDELQEEVAARSSEANEIRSASARTVRFRPLSQSMSMEAVVILRYGRWYLLYESARGQLNQEDFFAVESNGVTTVTPKPHRGHIVSEESLEQLTTRLKRSFPIRQFHVTIAVWNDSFAEFNPLKDAVTAAGYRYRTLTCDPTSSLSNQAAVDPFVQ